LVAAAASTVSGLAALLLSRPVGWRAPAWQLSAKSLELVAKHGFEYSSNMMDRLAPYLHPETGGRALVEIPVSWVLDDAPFFMFTGQRSIQAPGPVLQGWITEFDGITEAHGVTNFTFHPQIIGRPSRLACLRELLDHVKHTPRVWIAPGNTFDAATVALLPEFGIRIICDGYFRFPYVSPNRMTWVPQQLFYFRPAPSGVWTVCYHHNDWTALKMRKFREDVDDYSVNIASLEEVLKRNAPQQCKWSAWLCTHPRSSRFLIRSELKLWSWSSACRKRRQRADINAVQLSR